MANKAQVRAARALLDWSQDRLAAAAGVSTQTVRRLEAPDGSVAAESGNKVQSALEDAGIEFFEEFTADGNFRYGVAVSQKYNFPFGDELRANIDEVIVRLMTLQAFDDDEHRKAVASDARQSLERLVEAYRKDE